MNTFETITRLQSAVANKAMQGYSYKTWTDSFARSDFRSHTQNIKKKHSFKKADFLSLTKEQRELFLGYWSKDSNLMLLPLWLFEFIDPEEELICIDGNKSKQKDADNDTRGGYTAYGFEFER